MSNITLTRDIYGNVLQALAPSTNVAVSIGATSLNVALPPGTEVVRLCASCNCFFKFGTDNTVTASGSDPAFMTGSEIFTVPSGITYIAVIQNGAVTGSMSVTKMV